MKTMRQVVLAGWWGVGALLLITACASRPSVTPPAPPSPSTAVNQPVTAQIEDDALLQHNLDDALDAVGVLQELGTE